jgi:hypothetical protein
VLLILIGIYFVIDGAVSFMLYLDQAWYEQTVRIVRILVATLVVLLAPPTGIGLPRGKRRNLG